MHLIVGLGNPGSRYAGTRHNIGFTIVENLAARHEMKFKGSKHRADIARGTLGGRPVLLALPQTYMNESGNAVSRLVTYFRVPLPQLLVVSDDMDLQFGTIRIRPSGSAAGQRGLKSIIAALGTDDFPRLRVGIGRPRGTAVPHVLGRFTADEERLVAALVSIAVDAIEFLIANGVEPAMNQYNRSWLAELE